MNPGRVLCLVGSLLVCLMPFAAQAASFNCNSAASPDEVLICQSPDLSALDERMSSLYFHLRNRLVGGERRRLEADQTQWLRGRFNCGRDFGCVRGMYEQRISQLTNY